MLPSQPPQPQSPPQGIRAPSQWALSAKGKPGNMRRRRTPALPDTQSQAPSHRLQPFPLPGRRQELLPLQQRMSRAAGTTAPRELWGHVLAQLLHVPFHHRKTMDHEKQRDVDCFQAPETGTSHISWGKEEKQSGDAQGSTTNILPGKNLGAESEAWNIPVVWQEIAARRRWLHMQTSPWAGDPLCPTAVNAEPLRQG